SPAKNSEPEKTTLALSAMTPARISEAGEAFKLLDPSGISLLDAVRDYIAGHKRRNGSISFRLVQPCFGGKGRSEPSLLERVAGYTGPRRDAAPPRSAGLRYWPA